MKPAWLIAAVALAACGGESSPRPSAAVQPAVAAPAIAPVAPVAPAPLSPPSPTIEALAELVRDVDGAAAVAPPAEARVERVHVRPGDRVAIGAPIATVILPAIAVEAARVAGADQRLTTLTARRTALARLLAEGLGRAGELAEVDATLAEVRAERAVAAAAVRAAGATGAASGRLVLRAPIAGVVVEVAAAIGEHRGPADDPIARLAGGGATRVVARWIGAPPDGAAALILDDGSRRALAVAAVAPTPDAAGATAVWYDVVGAPLPPSTRGRVVVGATP